MSPGSDMAIHLSMTRTHPSFPIAFRVGAVLLALTVLSLLAVLPGAATPRDQLEAARKERAAIMDRVERARADYDAIGAELAIASQVAEEAEGRLEEVTANLQLTRERLDSATVKLEHVQTTLNERAAEAFMQGPGSGIEFLLGATTLSDLSDRLEFVDSLAQSDEDLAQQVRNTQNELAAAKLTLEHLQSEARREQIRASAARDEVLAKFDEQQALLGEIEVDLSRASQLVTRKDKAYHEWLKAQRAQGYGGAHSSVPLPAEWQGILERCPVDGPRTFSDGFGAPRYAGGYHLHKGVDLLAPSGTPIVAPFDGYARSDYNSLGGNVVFVTGRYGTVYNAHLSSYTSASNGPVQAGDVIGLVGDTGDATGIPHDHFEFHPNAMPSSWPSSAYGYSIIEDAINPYPLLVEACG
jgi:murein DD-endopeptidase MepM/ murein hydrolase activator NlpD